MSADNQLFAYGSLMFPEVWWHVVGSEPVTSDAVLPGHLAYTVGGQTFPGLVPASAGDRVAGVLYSGLTDRDWRRLDAFEDEFYLRAPVRPELPDGTTTGASTYLVPPGRRAVLSGTLWDRDGFERTSLATFVDRICGFDP